MTTSVTPNQRLAVHVEEPSFSMRQGANWSDYLAYRPVYPESFFGRIYDYHSQKRQTAWSVAHDVGAGCGIVSATLASRFTKVIISDPNDGYVALARKILVKELALPESRFRFLQESAEETSVDSASVDLVTACECIHWTNADAAIEEFGRELKPGGTLVMTHYTYPRIEGNERAQSIWREAWRSFCEKARGEVFDHAFMIANTGYDCLEIPERDWEKVRRIYINAKGNPATFMMSDLVGDTKVKEGEEKVWVEDEKDWHSMRGIDWLKGYFATWVPRVPEAEMQSLWDELESALDGKQVKIEIAVVMVLATKRA